MKKLDIRFCERNLSDEHSLLVMDHIRENYSDISSINTYRCLGNCSICNQGPYCTINDFLFNNKIPEKLKADIDKLLSDLKYELENRENKQNIANVSSKKSNKKHVERDSEDI